MQRENSDYKFPFEEGSSTNFPRRLNLGNFNILVNRETNVPDLTED